MQIKTIKDYYEQLYNKFPNVPKEDIRKICSYGWKQLYLHNSYGGDVLISNRDFWCYFGFLKNNPLKHFLYYIKKLAIKLRITHIKKRLPWDGYYYFSLNDSQYDEYLKQKNTKGRPKKWFTFKKAFLYQLYEECKICEYDKKYIFRVPYLSPIRYRIYVPELVTNKAEIYEIREPLKFKDIFTTYNDYDILCKRNRHLTRSQADQ